MKITEPNHTASAASVPAEGHPHILIVDDDPHVADVLVTLLEDEGFAVEHATDGEAALSQIEHHQPNVVLSDIRMPRLDGIALVQAIHGRWREIRVILMSASESPGDLEVPFVRKPFDLDDVLSLIVACYPEDHSSQK